MFSFHDKVLVLVCWGNIVALCSISRPPSLLLAQYIYICLDTFYKHLLSYQIICSILHFKLPSGLPKIVSIFFLIYAIADERRFLFNPIPENQIEFSKHTIHTLSWLQDAKAPSASIIIEHFGKGKNIILTTKVFKAYES